MPFLRAGFNPNNTATGIRAWTSSVHGNARGWQLAELRIFDCGDRFWYRKRRPGAFLAWGETCRFRDLLPIHVDLRRSYKRMACRLDTRAVVELSWWND